MIGTITFFGSGETSATGGGIFESIARQLQAPVRIAILETPAGFEVNSERVAGRVADFLYSRLQNYQPHIHVLAARKKGTAHSPDDPAVIAPLYHSNLIFLGPGSPTYTVRQLQGSLAWDVLQARHRLGTSLVLASAATIAAGAFALPVYEIYKVGEDPHWVNGLDLLAPFGLNLVLIPHWNNNDGGAELDTSRCFMGRARFESLLAMLPPGLTVLGVDEVTAVTLEFEARGCRVAGKGSAHVLLAGEQRDFAAGSVFDLSALGVCAPPPDPSAGLPGHVWREALLAQHSLAEQAAGDPPEVPPEVQRLVDERELARRQRDWQKADLLRQQAAALGWQIVDTPEGPQLDRR